MAAQAHLGHATALWNPMNSRWIFGIRQGIHIIGLEHTASHLRRACRVVEGVAERAGLILFVGTKRGHARIVVEAAKRAKSYHLFDRWRPGAITNRLSMLGGFDLQAVDPLDRPLDGFTEELLERPPVTPDLVVCLNPKENYVLLHECGLATIPTIGVIDTDADPTWVTYPIPANDDSLRCMQVIAGALSVAGETGKNRRLVKAQEGKVTYNPVNMEKERVKDPAKEAEH
jgi:small subunit ribosomal protein S2